MPVEEYILVQGYRSGFLLSPTAAQAWLESKAHHPVYRSLRQLLDETAALRAETSPQRRRRSASPPRPSPAEREPGGPSYRASSNRSPRAWRRGPSKNL